MIFGEIKKWADFVKISHTVFALPFALSAMLVAAREDKGWPGLETFLLILGAMFCARTCAMAFNRIVDSKFDGENPRTSMRHIPAGTVSKASAWTLWTVTAIGLIACSYFLNPICFYLSPVALFAVCFYSLTKRFTDFTHVYLGIALGLAPVGAWLAVKGSFGIEAINNGFHLPVILGIAVVFWLIGFDIIYAIQDYDFDKKHGLHSVVVRWGPKNALKAAFLSHVVMLQCLAVFGLLCRFRVAYFVAMGIILVSVLLEHWLARIRNMNWVQNAFFRLNAVISIVFVVGVAAEVILGSFRLVR